MSLQDRINKILWNRRYVILPDGIECPVPTSYLIINDLTLEDRNYYLFTREIELDRAKKDGLKTEEEILEDARKGGYWTEQDEEILSKADDHIAYLEGEIKFYKKNLAKANLIKLQLADAQAKKLYVEHKLDEFKAISAEYYAHETASLALIQRVVFLPDDSLLIPDERSLINMKSQYLILLFFLVKEVMSECFLTVPEIREVARSNEWRLIWTLNRENLCGIFDRCIGDLNLGHRLLIYWSRVYDSAFEGMDPPDRDITNDDEKFDHWLAERDLESKVKKDDMSDSKMQGHQERGQVLDGEFIDDCSCGMKDRNKAKENHGLGLHLPHASECRYGTWRDYTFEEKEAIADKIYSRNSPKVRGLINKEHEYVADHGEIEEQHLRGSKTRKLLNMPSKVISKG